MATAGWVSSLLINPATDGWHCQPARCCASEVLGEQFRITDSGLQRPCATIAVHMLHCTGAFGLQQASTV